jgi:hypothetical protein
VQRIVKGDSPHRPFSAADRPAEPAERRPEKRGEQKEKALRRFCRVVHDPFSAAGRIGPGVYAGSPERALCIGRVLDTSSRRHVAETEITRGMHQTPSALCSARGTRRLREPRSRAGRMSTCQETEGCYHRRCPMGDGFDSGHGVRVVVGAQSGQEAKQTSQALKPLCNIHSLTYGANGHG